MRMWITMGMLLAPLLAMGDWSNSAPTSGSAPVTGPGVAAWRQHLAASGTNAHGGLIPTNAPDGVTVTYSGGVLRAVAPAAPDLIARADIAVLTTQKVDKTDARYLAALTNAAAFATAAQGTRADMALTNETYLGTLTNIIVNGVTGSVAGGVASVTIEAGSGDSLPAYTNAAVVADAAGVIKAPTNLYTASAIARCPTAVVAFTNDGAGWYDAGDGTWTNASGWRTDGTPNGATVTLDAEEYIQSPLTTAGYAGYTNTAAGTLAYGVETSTDGVTWASAAYSVAPVYVRWLAANVPEVPGMTNVAILDDLVVYGWANTSVVGQVQDFAGLTLRADPPAGHARDIATAGYVQQQCAAVAASGSGSNWATYVAVGPVDFAGQALTLDPRYTLSVSGDALNLVYGGAPVWSIYGAGTVTPAITYFSIAGTSLTMRVVASIEYRPYPEWSTNLVEWTRYATNEFLSTWPTLTNGQATLSFDAPTTNPTAFYRVAAIQESTNTLQVYFHVPVTGPGMDAYANTNDVIRLDGNIGSLSNAMEHVIAGAARGAMAVTNNQTGVTLGGAFAGNGAGLTNVPSMSGITSTNITALIVGGTATITRAMGQAVYVEGGAPLTVTVQSADWAASDIGMFALGVYSTGSVTFLPATMTNTQASLSTTATNNIIFFKGIGTSLWTGR